VTKFLFLWVLVRVVGRLPVRVLAIGADVAGTLAWYLSPRLRDVTTDHMRHVLGTGDSVSVVQRAARGCVRSAARNYADFARGPRIPPGSQLASIEAIEGADHFFELLERGCGVIAFSAHLGAGEFLLRAMGQIHPRVMVFMEHLSPRAVHHLVLASRAAPGLTFVDADLAGARDALEHLRRGDVLFVLADRDVLHNGRPVAFFGERAKLPTGVVELALRTHLPLLPVTILRTGVDRVRIVVDAPIALDRTRDREADLAAGMRQLADALETCIRRAPDQWFALSPVWSGLAH
jgi:KDO2-lipid IV(A) lauroyltransferase